jgi:hypothetical protein
LEDLKVSFVRYVLVQKQLGIFPRVLPLKNAELKVNECFPLPSSRLSASQQHADNRDGKKGYRQPNGGLKEGFFNTATGFVDTAITAEDASQPTALGLDQDDCDKRNRYDNLN